MDPSLCSNFVSDRVFTSDSSSSLEFVSKSLFCKFEMCFLSFTGTWKDSTFHLVTLPGRCFTTSTFKWSTKLPLLKMRWSRFSIFSQRSCFLTVFHTNFLLFKLSTLSRSRKWSSKFFLEIKILSARALKNKCSSVSNAILLWAIKTARDYVSPGSISTKSKFASVVLNGVIGIDTGYLAISWSSDHRPISVKCISTRKLFEHSFSYWK